MDVLTRIYALCQSMAEKAALAAAPAPRSGAGYLRTALPRATAGGGPNRKSVGAGGIGRKRTHPRAGADHPPPERHKPRPGLR